MFFADFSFNSQPILMKFCKDYFRVTWRLPWHVHPKILYSSKVGQFEITTSLYQPIKLVKGVVNCQNTRDNVVPRMQQWPLDIPQWHITPHPQLSAKIITQYASHTHRRIKSKFTSHINSIYLSDIYEEIIYHFSNVGFVLRHKRLCYCGDLETVDL